MHACDEICSPFWKGRVGCDYISGLDHWEQLSVCACRFICLSLMNVLEKRPGVFSARITFRAASVFTADHGWLELVNLHACIRDQCVSRRTATTYISYLQHTWAWYWWNAWRSGPTDSDVFGFCLQFFHGTALAVLPMLFVRTPML